MTKIYKVIRVIQCLIEKLRYPEELRKWIKSYHSTISEWDINLIAQVLSVAKDENCRCIFLQVINTYGISISNPDIRLVIR